MTHVLDEAIAALEGDIRDIRKYGPGVCDPNDDSRSDAVSMVRSKAAALRILRAERDSPSARGREIESRARDAAAREVAGHRAAGREVYGKPALARLEEARAEREGRRLAGARDADGRPISSKLERHHMEALMGKTLDEIRSEERVEREDELRAEGRREERERVLSYGRKQAQRIHEECKGTPLDDEAEYARDTIGDFLDEVERGDHWRGGEG